MAGKGWIKSIYFLIPQWESRIRRGRPCRYASSRPDYNDLCYKVSSAPAGLSCGQPLMGFLAGFSIPCDFLCCRWHRSRHSLDGCRWNDRSRSFQMIHVKCCVGVESPPCGTLFCVDCDSGPILELDTDGAAEPSLDMQVQCRTASRRTPRTRA